MFDIIFFLIWYIIGLFGTLYVASYDQDIKLSHFFIPGAFVALGGPFLVIMMYILMRCENDEPIIPVKIQSKLKKLNIVVYKSRT